MDKAGQVIVREEDNKVVIEQVPDISSLKGSLHSHKRFTRAQERAGFEKAIAAGEV